MCEIESFEGEVWRVIDHPSIGCYPNYMVSNIGRVKSLSYNKTGKERLRKLSKHNGGYLTVCLREKSKKKKHLLVHRLVAIMFIPNPLNLPQVNHLNEVKTDNRIENLEWCDAKYNLTYGTKIERRKETIKSSIRWKEGIAKVNAKKAKKVYQYTIDGELVNVYTSLSEAALYIGAQGGNISACCLGKTKSCRGYIFRYEPLPNTSNQLTLFPLTEKKIS